MPITNGGTGQVGTGQDPTVITVFNTSQLNASPVYITNWELFQGSVMLGAGNWTLQMGAAKSYVADNLGIYDDSRFVYSNGSFDAVQLSSNGVPLQGCAGSTPTPTATGAPSRTPTPSAMPTWTPTPVITRTPGPTSTPRVNSLGTPIPPSSQCNDCEVPSLDDREGERVDDVCFRPGNWLDLSAWVEYGRCSVIFYFSWNTNNTAQLVRLGSSLQRYEPFGTFAELLDAGYRWQILIEQYGFLARGGQAGETAENAIRSNNIGNGESAENAVRAGDGEGYEGATTVRRRDIVADIRNAFEGNYSFATDQALLNELALNNNQCTGKLVTKFSSSVSQGMCMVWSFYHIYGIREWIQWFFEFAVWWSFLKFMYQLNKEVVYGGISS